MKRASICGLVLVQALSGGLVACGSGAGGEAAGQGSESVSEVSLSLTALPSGVQCIQVNVASGTTSLASQTFTAAANWTGTVSLGAFNKGTVTVNANAYSVACSAITGVAPTWVADSVSIDVTPGRPNPAALNFRQNFGIAASGNFSPAVVDIAVGYYSTGLVLADGTVKMFGSVVQPTTALTGVVELAVGYSHACARKTDGTVWCWGDNDNGELGNGTTTSSNAPVKVTGITGATSLAAGFRSSCATTAPFNSVSCWGNDSSGQFGDGTTVDKLTPINTGYRAARMSFGEAVLCVVDTGSLKGECSGDNTYGELGIGSTTTVTGVIISDNSALSNIAGGYGHVCAVDTSGRLSCWGNNSTGQLGLGNETNALTPTLVSSLTAVAEVSAPSAATCARTTSGAVYCWGDNFYGELGDGTNTARLAPTTPILQNSKKIRSAGYNTCSLQADASVLCWGYNGFGELGDGTFTTSNKPIPVKL
jgi:Regulator of chromosome condensation (RCC1) repeat